MNRDPNAPFRIGIICNGSNWEDIASYNAQFRQINQLSKGNVTLVFMGYRPEDDKDNALSGVAFEAGATVSIIHWFKQLIANKIDLLFIPLINSKYNTTSEDLKKYFEAALVKIPVMVLNIFPYNVISNQITGFTYEEPNQMIDYLVNLLTENLPLIQHCGTAAHIEVVQRYNATPENIMYLENVFLGKPF